MFGWGMDWIVCDCLCANLKHVDMSFDTASYKGRHWPTGSVDGAGHASSHFNYWWQPSAEGDSGSTDLRKEEGGNYQNCVEDVDEKPMSSGYVSCVDS